MFFFPPKKSPGGGDTAAMMLEVILCQSFSENVSHLVFHVKMEDLYESLAHVFTKMMITYVDVLGPWA
jgi:hypothetical protein